MEKIKKEIMDWLQEAAERLLRQGDLGAGDLSDLCLMIRTPEARKTANHRAFDESFNISEIEGDAIKETDKPHMDALIAATQG